jgi:hypothetical protein
VPVFVAWIGEMLLSIVGQMALSALVSVGIGFALSAGFSGVIDSTWLQSMLGQAGPLLGWVGFFQIDRCMTVVLSAWAGRRIVDAARVHLIARAKPSGS